MDQNGNIIKEQDKPLTGTPRYTPGSSGFGLKDDQGNAVGDTWYSVETPVPAATDESARIGDYVLQKGKAVVVPNSPTDLTQKYRIVVGGTEAPVNTVSIANEGLGATAGVATGAVAGMLGGLPGMAAGAIVGGIAGALNAHNTAAEEALKKWQEENVKYDSAVEFYRDDKGDLRYNIDYQKMGTGGPRSGEAVKEAQTRETKVELGDDGRLKVTVSPIFASTARFQELMDWVSENYAGLTRNTENYDQIIEELRNGIDGETKSFVTNMKLYADYANSFPDATPESIVSAYMTEVAGYLDPEQMGDFQMSVIGDNGVEIKTAKEFFDSVYNMDKDERNKLLERLTKIVHEENNDVDDNTRAVASGEIKALYAVSANSEGYKDDKYQGMLDADPFITFLTSFSPLGLNVGDVLHTISGGELVKTKQEFLNQNELAQFIGGAGGIAAGFGLWKAGTTLVEKALKLLPGTSQLFQASIEGRAGAGAAAAKLLWNAGEANAVGRAYAASAAFKTLKVGLFDAALSGTKTAVSDTEFWPEFGRDFTRDMLLELAFSYYDMVAYEKAVYDPTTYVYKDPNTGDVKTLPTYQSRVFEVGKGASVYEPIGAYNIQKTKAGDTIGKIQSEFGEAYIYNGNTVYVSPTGETQKLLTSPDAVTDGVPALRTGISEGVDITTDLTSDVATALERMGLPRDTEVFQLPTRSAAAAEAASKIAKFDTTKTGLSINKYLFNKNAVLDTVNELALAKTGDLTAWQDRSQKTVDVFDNARQERNLIKTGSYVEAAKKAFDDYEIALGKLNYGRTGIRNNYKKADANYLKAVVQLERAAFLDKHKPEDDPRDYTKEALEKYGEAVANVPEDRAELLNDFLQKRKARHDLTKRSAKASGKIDVKELDKITDSDLQKEIGWVPQWRKKETYNGLLSRFYGISPERNIYKEWLPEGEWVDLEMLEDPVRADDRFLDFITTNMGLNDMTTSTIDALEDAGLLVDNTPTSATIRKRKLESIKNKEELKSKLSEMIKTRKKEVEEKVMNQKQYKDWVLDLYKKYDIDGSINDVFSRNAISARSWDKIWKNASPEVRKTIRSELEKTSLQTGYGIKDTRARLNAQVPGADVLDWSLLGRNHTNGLVPGGLYAGKSAPVKAYIMSIDDLAKLAGYDLDNAIPDMGKVVEKHINVEDAVPMLPAHIRGSGDGPEIWLKMRWGHNSDGMANWTDYLKTLKERGIEKVPVAIDDARGSDFNSVFYQVRNSGLAQKGMDNMVAEIDRVIASGEKPNFDVRDISAALHLPGMSRDRLRKRIRSSIQSTEEEAVSFISDDDLDALLEKAEGYDWANDAELDSLADNIENVVKNKIGYVPQDITADVQRAFSEYGRIPWFHNQHKPLGSAEFNGEPPVGELAYTAKDGVGDALWVAPNSSYTNTGEYGKNQTVGTIPVKYFMSDKEMRKLSDSLAKELRKLRDKAAKKGLAELRKEDDRILKNVKQEVLHTQKDSIDDAMTQFNLHEAGWSSGLEEKHGAASYYVDNLGLLYKGKHHFIDGNVTKKLPAFDFTFTPLNEIYHTPREENQAIEEGSKLLPKKDKARYDELSRIVEPYVDGQKSSKVVSYRALAEYAKKPVIDTSIDMGKRGISGTAYFYYKGVSPEFDKEIGQQLASQALFDRQNPQWNEDTIASAMEEYDDMSLDEMIDYVTMGEGFSEDWDDLFEQFEAGKISSSELSEEVSKFFKGVEKRYPGIGKVMQETWDNNIIQDLRDMKFTYWHSSTGYPTIDDDVAVQFLEDMGERPPQAGEPVPEGQTSMWDTINPTNFANVPTEPQFKQPSRVTYNDYSMGVQADPNTRNRVRDAIKASQIDNLVRNVTSLLYEAAEYNKDFGYTFDTRSYLNTSLIPDLNNSISNKDKSLVAGVVNKGILDVAPYRSRSEMLKSAQESVAEEWREWAEKHIKAGRVSYKDLKQFVKDHSLDLPDDKRSYPSKVKHALWEKIQSGKRLPKIEGIKPNSISKDMAKEDFYKMLDETPLFQSAIKDKRDLVDLVAEDINGTTTDAYEMGAAKRAVGMGGKYPITTYRKGRPYTRFITYRNEQEKLLAENISEVFSDKQLMKQAGLISRVASTIANDFRLFMTGWDPTRGPINFMRDTGRGQITSGGQSLIQAKKMLKSVIETGDYTPKEKAKLSKAMDNVANMVSGETYNAAYGNRRKAKVQATKNYLSKTGAHPLKVFTYNLIHDKRSILEYPTNMFEGFTRKRLARSAAAIKLGQLQEQGASFDEQLKGAMDAAFFAGREYTANFQRKGKLIGAISKYVAYASTPYAGLESLKRAYINNPQGVTRNFATFLVMYLILLADTLGDEDSRRNYYRLSDYDRGNSLVISLDDNTILTIPLDQEIAGFLFPYRRFMETLNGVDPVSFFEFMWGTFTEPLPMDLSGFSEGEGFNLGRGLQKLTAQNLPNIIAGVQEASTGTDLYYGSTLSVSDETLKEYGIYDPQPGDYTTTGKNSAILRQIANATGIPQWQLQVMVENYSGNVGSYILNLMDKFSGATEEEQGGKDFVNAIFRSFVATDQNNANNVFYDGVQQLKKEKRKLVQQIANYNEDLKTASGSAKVEIQAKIQKAKDDFAVKVADFVDKYVSAYEITGGLPKNQAMQIYYLFRLDDDFTVYEEGSPEQYYNKQAVQKFKNQATAMSAPILDKYYNNRIGNIYQDANGEWRRYLSSGTQAMRTSIYGQGEEHMVNLLNVLEGKSSNMTTLRKQVKDARGKAYDVKDYDTADKLAYMFDSKVIEAISPYIERYGAENVLGNTEVLDYLSDWFFVPDKFKRTKRGKYVSLGHNASAQEAFVRPYIKYVFGLPTNYYSYSDTSLTSPSLGDTGR